MTITSTTIVGNLTREWSRAGARCQPLGRSVSPTRSPNRLRGISHNRFYVQRVVMLKLGLACCVFPTEGGFGW